MSDLVKLQKIASVRSLLYIDGDKATQKNYSIYLKKAFQNFYQAYDGQEGLSLFEKHKPEVVILNLELDKMDAVELISEITDINEDVIMIAVSQECENYDLLQTLDMGLAKNLLKPIGFAKIAHLLISLLPPPPKPKLPEKSKFPEKPKPVEKKIEVKSKPKVEKLKTVVKKEVPKQVVKQTQKKEEVKPKVVKKQKPIKADTVKKQVLKKVVEKPSIKTDLEICLDLIKELYNKQTSLEFINSYKGVMVLHDGVIKKIQGKSFFIKVNIAQALAAKSEKQVMVKTIDNKYIHAQLKGIDLKTTTLEFINPRILKYKQRNKEYARIMADKSFKASMYYKKKHIDFAVSYISFHSAVLLTENVDIDIKPGAMIDITFGFDISGPNAMIKDKKFTKVFAKCEVIRVDEHKSENQIIILFNVSKAGERTLKKYLLERESEIIYEFKSRIRR